MAGSAERMVLLLLLLGTLGASVSALYRNDYNPLFCLGLYTLITLQNTKHAMGLAILVLVVTGVLDVVWLATEKPTFSEQYGVGWQSQAALHQMAWFSSLIALCLKPIIIVLCLYIYKTWGNRK